jgi:hypothetical protein
VVCTGEAQLASQMFKKGAEAAEIQAVIEKKYGV